MYRGPFGRRDYFGETDFMVNKKVRALAESSFNAIVCVGESLAVRDAGDAVRFVCDQVRALRLPVLTLTKLSIARLLTSPFWAIGTGRTATPEQAEIASAIRATVADLVGEQAAQKMRVLYGGSMKAQAPTVSWHARISMAALLAGPRLKLKISAKLVEIASGYAE